MSKPINISLVLNISYIDAKPLNNIAGIPKRKENRAAVSLVIPKNKPAVIVVPERDEPGINAKHCENPTIIESFNVIDSSVLFRFEISSATNNTIASEINDVAITIGSFVKDPDNCFFSAYPIVSIGMVPTPIYHPKRELVDCFLIGTLLE